jgi:hypothetical protein
MATLCRSYPSEAAARRAIDGLRAAGLPPQGAHLITGHPPHDLRQEPVGEFARTVEPDAPVGTFANTTVERWRPGGTFAGDPDLRREGSFADADSQVVIHDDPAGHGHTRVVGLKAVAALCEEVGLEDADVERALAALRAGASLVLVQIAEIGPADAAARLEAAA